MANIELAKAYVTIVPSMTGAQQSITNGLTGAADTAGSQAGSRAGSAFTRALGVAASAGAAAVGAISTGLTAIGTQAVNAYSDFEQLAGGIETLYGTGGQTLDEYARQLGVIPAAAIDSYRQLEEAQNMMMEYAAQAATTTGQSMNEYMESAISTSAAMISAVEGDERRAAELTNMSMIDMADNANKLGTDMESIQNAYRGFSRGNFTMLDNLALGYAGTAEGMAQLLADAEAISGVEYDIDSYADIVQAIHVVQENMGIAGTTAREASETIQGSLGALGASWENLLTGLANPDADIGALIEDTIGKAEIVLDNILPVIETTLSGLGTAISTIAPIIAERLPGIISSILPSLLTAAADIVEGLAQGIIQVLPVLGPIAADLIVNFITFVLDNIDDVINSAVQIVVAVCDGISRALPELIPAAVSAVNQICVSLIDSIDLLVPAALELMIGLGLGLIAAIPDLLATVPQIATALKNELVSLGPSIVDAALTWGADLIGNFVSGIEGSVGRLIDSVSEIASTVQSYLGFSEPEKGPLSNFHTYGPDMIDLFCEGIEESTPELEATLNQSLALPTISAPSALGEYESDWGSTAGETVQPVNIFIGQEKLDTIMLKSSQLATFRRGL